jgi:glutaredoxin
MANNTAKLTLIKRSTPACPACNIMKAQLDGEGIEYETIDITHQPEKVSELNLTGVPVLMIERDNGSMVRLHGVQPIDEVKALINE